MGTSPSPRRASPGDVYVYGQGENISMRDWVDLILRVGEAEGFWPAGREVVSTSSRHRPGSSEVMALRVGHEKLTAETGWQPQATWEQGVLRDDPLVRGEPRALDRPRRLAVDRRAVVASLALPERLSAHSCASSVHRTMNASWSAVGAWSQRKTTLRCCSSRGPGAATDA